MTYKTYLIKKRPFLLLATAMCMYMNMYAERSIINQDKYLTIIPTF